MTRVSQDVRDVRSRICDVLLIVLSIVAAPALAFSLYRATAIGWLPIMTLQVVLFAALYLFTLFRKRLPYNLRAGFIVVAYLLLGVGGTFQLGLIGTATVFLVGAPAVGAIFFGARIGVFVLLVSLASLGLAAAYYAGFREAPSFDLLSYVVAPSAWLSAIVGAALAGGTLLAALVIYNRDLAAALESANLAEDELTRRIDQRTEELTREIDERRAVESELRSAESALLEANSSLEARIDERTRELQTEKELFRSIVENSPMMLTLKDADGSFTVVNPVARSYIEAAGGTVAEGKSSYETWPAAVGEGTKERDRAVADSKRAMTSEILLPTRDGTRVIRTTKFPVVNANGAVTAIGTIGVDITREQEAERRLRESEERFRGIVENSPNAFSLKDTDGRYILVNKQFETLMGMRREDVIGKTTEMIFEGVFGYSGVRQDREVIQSKQVITSEELFDRGDRPLKFLTTKFPILDSEGNVAFVGAVHTDLTRRMEAEAELSRREAEYRQLVELIPDAVVVQVDGKVTLANQSAVTMFGAASAEDMIGRESLGLVHPDYQNFVLGLRNRTLRDQTLVSPIGTRHLRLDGTAFDSEFTTGPIVWEGRMATVSLIRDVTERKKTEEQLHQAQKMESVGQLTGGVAHDFNNLLAIILGNAEFLSEAVGERRRAEADAIVRAAQRGADLTHRLLAFSRKQMLEPRVLTVNSIVLEMIDLLRRTLGEHIEIETRTAEGLWDCEIDAAQFENVLLNLSINARDAMPDGGKLTIETANTELDAPAAAALHEATPGQYVLVSVSDTGMGMEPGILEQVFEPFFTTKELGKGTGLGLSMVYGFAKQSGGQITIDSEVGEGTTIKLFLPRYKGRKEAFERRGQATRAVKGKGELVLVVEDDDDLQTMVTNMLQSLGYGVEQATTAKDALSILERSNSVSLLLTDMMLPGGMSGAALADWAREKHPDLPVLYMSGFSDAEIAHHGHPDGNVRLLEKPFRKADIARAVRDALDDA